MFGGSNKMEINDMGVDYVDEEYETRMVAFEMDCNDGKGVAEACTCILILL